jgi:hypothetical protein
MNTRALISALASILTLGSAAHAQDNTGIVGPLPPLAPAPNCYKVQANNTCVIVGPHIVDFERPHYNVLDLNGAWADMNGNTLYIYFYADPQYAAGYTIAVDLSLVNRPDGFGYMSDAETLSIYYPDDRDYTGKVENNGTSIRWSNNTVWTKR